MSVKKGIFALLVVFMAALSQLALAATTGPAAAFTLRSSSNAGPATGIDSTWGNGGFEGFLSNLEGGQVDRTYLEYATGAFGGGVASASLDFNLFGNAGDIITMSWYTGNGSADLGDWFASLNPFTTFNAGAGSYSIDITSLINANLALPYIGFAFSIDSHPNQAFFDMNGVPHVTFEAAVPEPEAFALLGLGLMGLALTRRRQRA